MVSTEDFKKALGSLADGMTDEEIQDANERMSRLAGTLFSMYARKLESSVTAIDPDSEAAVK